MDIFTPVQQALLPMSDGELKSLAESCGVSHGTLVKIKYRNTTNPRVRTAEKVYEYLFEGGEMTDAFQIVRDLEKAVSEYTGAPSVVAVNSCSSALLMSIAWYVESASRVQFGSRRPISPPVIEIPKKTYVSVPAAIIHAGGIPKFRDEEWIGAYRLKPLPVWDAARLFTAGMFHGLVTEGMGMVCVSFHHSKILGDTQGGAILHNCGTAVDNWLRRARFDGRTEGVAPQDDVFDIVGYHAYMSPDVAARLLWKMPKIPPFNEPLPNDPYPDLSLMPAFK